MQGSFRAPTVDLGLLFPIRKPVLAGGRWLLGLAILAALLTFFWSCGVFAAPAGPGPRPSWGAALFFSVTIAYLVPIFGYISERTVTAFRSVMPALQADASTVDAWARRLERKPVSWLVSVLIIGGGAGVGHNLMLNYGDFRQLHQAANPAAMAAIIAGTELIWIIFTLVIAALIDNAIILNRAARRARLGPFDTEHLRPFATVAVISTLALIGAQAAFPIMSIEGGLDALAYIPGLLATSASILVLAALPVWPLHRRLVRTKRALLRDLNEQLRSVPLPAPGELEAVSRIQPLLTYRREVSLSPEWPFDVGVLTRLALYLIIPPLTWVGAALIENVVETFL